MQNKAVLAEEIDKFGDLDKELAPFKSKIAEREKLRKIIVARFENEAADQEFTGEGERYSVKLSARTMKWVWKPGALKRLATFLDDRFFKICDVGLEDFEGNVTILDRPKFGAKDQIGYRRITATVEKAEVAKAA